MQLSLDEPENKLLHNSPEFNAPVLKFRNPQSAASRGNATMKSKFYKQPKFELRKKQIAVEKASSSSSLSYKEGSNKPQIDLEHHLQPDTDNFEKAALRSSAKPQP